MNKVHHVDDRSIEHAKTRDTMAHRLITPTAPDGLRSTRGFAAVKGSQPAVDIQPRHGGKPKGGVIEHSWGNTEQQIAGENLTHKVIDAVSGAPDASSANPLDLMTSSQVGKRLPVPAIHNGMRGHAALGINDGSGVLSETVKSGSTELPATVKEEDCK